MSYGKKRLAVFLSMLVVFMTVFELVPAPVTISITAT